METPDPEWDRWWLDRLSKDTAEVYPYLPTFVHHYKGRPVDPVNSDALLVGMMAEYGLRTVLCAGNGVSQEPRALARAGLEVTALDISSVATRFAETFQDDPQGRHAFGISQICQPGGRAEFVVGDLLDHTICPGPFDVIIERRTIQVLPQNVQGSALSALSARLGRMGIFLSQCLDDPLPMDLGWSQHESGLFHVSQSWFEARGWMIWDGIPSSALEGQVAWLVRAGSMKPRPNN